MISQRDVLGIVILVLAGIVAFQHFSEDVIVSFGIVGAIAAAAVLFLVWKRLDR